MHRTPMQAHLIAVLFFYNLPHANRLIPTAGCEIGDACNWSMETFNHCQILTRIHIPQPHCLIPTARGDLLAAGRIHHARNIGSMTAQ
ncbi:hypothetical protein BC939DRAFT_461354, partial [Gamsiella multidivaricata]|uniref:uncharacterized protein n=1 Tax=Gamsiella multidivaricata TaxID=101098 RepID=UPI002220C4BA